MEGYSKVRTYIIPKGWHKSIGNKLRFHRGFNVYKFKVFLGTDLYYAKQDHTGINKICGFTLGGYWNRIHKTSIRIGWQPDYEIQDLLNLFLYWYDETKDTYQSKLICKVYSGISIEGVMTRLNNDIIEVCINAAIWHRFQVPFKSPKNLSGRYCYPYHGGQCTAPNTECFLIKQEIIN